MKELGYGLPVRAVLDGDPPRTLVVHRLRAQGYGHETLADHAADALFAWESFGRLPSHVPAVDVGLVRDDGSFGSIAGARDFFYVTPYADGEPYFRDLDAIAARGNVAEPRDLDRATVLARYLGTIHRQRHDQPELYARRIRDLFGHHECLAGLVDSYEAFDTGGYAPAGFFEDLERRAVRHRHRLKRNKDRLTVVHGDFHPWNVLFDAKGELVLLDRSRGEYGEAADDLAAMAVNYLFFSLRCEGRFEGGFAELFRRFFDEYLAVTGDGGVLAALPPFLVWRALVVASPAWYPHIDLSVRRALFRLIDRLLDLDRFEPGSVEELLTERL